MSNQEKWAPRKNGFSDRDLVKPFVCGLGSVSSIFGMILYMMDEYYGVLHVM